MLPSASSLVMVRTLQPTASLRRLAFVGFGDPLFNPTRAAPEDTPAPEKAIVTSSGARKVRVRGIRRIVQGDLDSRRLISCPAEVPAPPSRHCRGNQASERQVKTMNLSDRKIVAFATHGLVPGDLDGLDQPAIDLSSLL